jgi:Tripartite tricarboxylate transporter family receptor
LLMDLKSAKVASTHSGSEIGGTPMRTTRSTSSSPTARRGRVAKRALALSALGIVATPAVASATTTPARHFTPLQQGLRFYSGKTIRLIAPDAPGGGFDTVARIVAPYLSSYLHATIDVTNVPAANTIAGQDLMEASAPDGLTIGMVNAGTDIEDIVTRSPGVNFNPQKTQFLGGNDVSAGAGFECLASSGITNFSQVVNARRPVTEVSVSSGTQTLQLDLLNAAFHINAKVVGGYTNTSGEVAGEERGDANCGVLSISTPGWGSFMAAGKAHMLLVNTTPNPATAYSSTIRGAMSVKSAYLRFPATSRTERLARSAYAAVTTTGVGHQFNAPARTPVAEVAALRAAVQSALTNHTVENRLLAAGQNNGWVTGPRALSAYKAELAALTPASALIRTALGI